jgi:hypothetical protein
MPPSSCACSCSYTHFVLSSHLSPHRSVHHKPQCRCWLFRHRFPLFGCASFVANCFSAFLAFMLLIRIGRFSLLQSSRSSLELHALFNQCVSRLYEPTFLHLCSPIGNVSIAFELVVFMLFIRIRQIFRSHSSLACNCYLRSCHHSQIKRSCRIL